MTERWYFAAAGLLTFFLLAVPQFSDAICILENNDESIVCLNVNNIKDELDDIPSG